MIFYYEENLNKNHREKALQLSLNHYCRENRILGHQKQDSHNGFEIKKGEHGKPYIEEIKNLHFSISHSGHWWVCVVDNQPIGMDIECIQHRGGPENLRFRDDSRAQVRGCHLEPSPVADRLVMDDLEPSPTRGLRIAERFFAPNEIRYIKGGGDFYEIWTRKEAYVKYTGRGIAQGLDTFSVVDDNNCLVEKIGEVYFGKAPIEITNNFCSPKQTGQYKGLCIKLSEIWG